MARLAVAKTYKLFIGGGFPRTESGRSLAIMDRRGRVAAHICRASRKDFRNAVEAAEAAQEGWQSASAYLRGQVIYRMAEMLEGRREEFAAAISTTCELTPAAARQEVDASVDRLVHMAGWADKVQQVLGTHNPVSGPYYNFTIPQPTGVVAVVSPDVPALLGLVTLIAAPLCSGNTIVAIASESHPLCGAILGEVCQTSDVPAGVINLLTGKHSELLDHVASHRQVAAIAGANLRKKDRTLLEAGAAENLKRVRILTIDDDAWPSDQAVASPWAIEPFVEMKTIWHPSAC